MSTLKATPKPQETVKVGVHRATGLPKDRVAWTVRRWQVMDRAKGVCEQCGKAPGVYVRHLRFATVVGHEDPSWLKLVCLDCQWELNRMHGRPRPPKRRKTPEQIAAHGQIPALQRDRKREAKAVADAKARKVCAYCGGLYPRAKHYAICVRHGLDKPKPA